MADHGNIVEELKTPLETHAKIFEESCRGSRLVGRILADCKRGPSVDTSSHILKVLGLVSWQGLLPVGEVESTPTTCCQLSEKSILQGLAVSSYDLGI